MDSIADLPQSSECTIDISRNIVRIPLFSLEIDIPRNTLYLYRLFLRSISYPSSDEIFCTASTSIARYRTCSRFGRELCSFAHAAGHVSPRASFIGHLFTPKNHRRHFRWGRVRARPGLRVIMIDREPLFLIKNKGFIVRHYCRSGDAVVPDSSFRAAIRTKVPLRISINMATRNSRNK